MSAMVSTGREDMRTCEWCGAMVWHQELAFIGSDPEPWWCPIEHPKRDGAS